MSLAIIYTRAKIGIEAPLVTVEVHLSNGLPSLSIVGLPETAVKESKDRVRSAILNSSFEYPIRRITVNLAPADLPKEGGRYDLPIALGILAASGQIPQDKLNHYEFLGELALSGLLRPVMGVLPAALQCAKSKRAIIVPKENGDEASLSNKVQVLTSDHLNQVCAHITGQTLLDLHEANPRQAIASELLPNMSDVKGQAQAKRALEIAAAGAHNLLMVGPPGTGKTMLASRLPGILPPLSDDEALQVAAIASISNKGFNPETWRIRPLRSPHHTASAVALVGGGSNPKPGEISLAHHGILFLDELPEFSRQVLEVLREPLESGEIVISRASHQVAYPARFQLISAMNPCPCGYFGDSSGRCHCSTEKIKRYHQKISGPLLDRIDMHIQVPRPPKGTFKQDNTKSTDNDSDSYRSRISMARQQQLARHGKPNNALTPREMNESCQISEADQHFLENAAEKLDLSARAYHRILKVSRTIADLANSDKISIEHLTEALSYRSISLGSKF